MLGIPADVLASVVACAGTASVRQRSMRTPCGRFVCHSRRTCGRCGVRAGNRKARYERAEHRRQAWGPDPLDGGVPTASSCAALPPIAIGSRRGEAGPEGELHHQAAATGVSEGDAIAEVPSYDDRRRAIVAAGTSIWSKRWRASPSAARQAHRVGARARRGPNAPASGRDRAPRPRMRARRSPRRQPDRDGRIASI
jgi:hypothetical protein